MKSLETFSFCHLVFCHFFSRWVAGDNASPELDKFVFTKIGKNDLWAATHTVVRDRGPSKAAAPSTGHPFLSECLPPAQQAWLNGLWAHLQATGVYGLADPHKPRLAWSLAVWSWFHEASSFASCRTVIISKRGTERTAEGSNYLSCQHLFHHQVGVSTPSKRDKSKTEYPSIVGHRFISLNSTSPWWVLPL